MLETDEGREKLKEVAQEIYPNESVYLCGPIRFCESGGHGWRNEVIEQYSEQFNFINPLDRHDSNAEDVEVINDPIHYDEDSDKEQILAEEIVSIDKTLIDGSDYVLVGLKDVIARGTSMEIMYANLTKTPVYIWCLDSQEVSPWIYAHAEYVHDDLEAVMQRLGE